jgi:hypothetical protein
VPFLLCLWLLGRIIFRELGSLTTALVAVAAFSLSSLDSEVIYWYSASSFSWALLWTLLALSFAGSASRSGGRGALAGLALASAMAPACSAIGLMAGPLGAIRLVLDARPRSPRLPRFAWIVPPIGTIAYLAACVPFRYQAILSSSMEHRADFGSGMSSVLCAPTNVLLPGLFGLNFVELGPHLPLNLGLAALGLVGILAWAIRSPDRSLIVGGLWLVLCGYVMTYCFRTQRFGASWLFRVERYHFFPMVGFTFWTALASRRWLSRYDGRPLASLVVGIVVAALLLATHLPNILAHSRFYDFPGQRRTLAALEDLRSICRRERITRGQALAALGPIVLDWSKFDYLGLLPPSVEASGVPDREVRRTLLASLSLADREALWGGMDVSPYLRPAADLRSHPGVAGRLVGASRVRILGEGRCRPMGWPSYLEFEMPDRVDDPDGASPVDPAGPSLHVPGGVPGRLTEVWWTGVDGDWSEARSVRWKSDPEAPSRAYDLSLAHLPHLDPAHVRRVRIMFRTAGQAAIDAPRLLR